MPCNGQWCKASPTITPSGKPRELAQQLGLSLATVQGLLSLTVCDMLSRNKVKQQDGPNRSWGRFLGSAIPNQNRKFTPALTVWKS